MNTRTVRQSKEWARYVTLRQLTRVPRRNASPMAIEGLASLLWEQSPRVRRGLSCNLAQVLGRPPWDAVVERAARAAHRHLLRNYLDLLRAATMTAGRLRAQVTLENESILRRVTDEFGACILLGGHFAGGELGMQALAAAGWSLSVVAEHVQPELLHRGLCRLRAAHGHRFVPSDGSQLAVVRTLRAGGRVGLALDRDTSGSGRLVTCFDARARLPAGAVRLSLRYGVPLVPVYTCRDARGRTLVSLEEPLPWTTDRRHRVSPDQGVAALALVLEEMVKRCPEQWVLTTPLWEAGSDLCA